MLKPGQFALYHIQFRVGDSTRVYSEWHALRYLSQLYLPVKVPWLSVNSVDATERTIAERFGRASGAPTGVPVSFNQAAIANYYRDYIVDGKIAFVRSHYGEERAMWVEKSERELERRYEGMVEGQEKEGDSSA